MIGILGIVAQLTVVAHAPETVFACDAVEVSIAVSAPGSSIPQLRAPSFGAFDVLRISAPRVQYSRPRSMVLAEYRYIITTDQSGQFTIPPFEASVGNERLRSRPLSLTVFPRRGQALPSVIARARIDTGNSNSLGATEGVDTVYVGQQATYEVAVFLNRVVRERLRRNPTFYPPDMQAMLAYDLPAPDRGQRRTTGSQCFDALVYRRALFPLVAGRVVIPPAQLVYSTGISASSLYSREESHELQTDSVTIVAVEPPAAGRPPEYLGAVGSMRLDARLDSLALGSALPQGRVGDPMLFTVRITGSGNVKLLPRPEVRVPWAGLVAADERVVIDSTSARISGQKEFDWVLTPRIAGEFDIPPVRYGYFDPTRRAYDVATTDPARVRVTPGTLASGDTATTDPVLGIRTRYGGPSWPPLHSRPAFWLVMALAPMPVLVRGARRRRAVRAAIENPNAPLQALVSATARDAVTLRRQYVRALAQRLGCSAEDFTHPGALDRALRRAGVSPDTAHRAELLLRTLDSAAYAGTGEFPVAADREAMAVAKAVDAEALSRGELPFWLPVLIVGALAASATVALATDLAGAHFARGVSQYLRQDYVAARDAFAEAVTVAPTAPDAWANYGTASWAIGDTAAAVLGWRQALALQPGATDAHERLEVVRSVSMAAPGWVPSMPKDAMVWLFAVLWLGAWVSAWFARGERPWTFAKRLPVPLAVLAALVGLMAIETGSRISGVRLAVVETAVHLSSDPALGMDREAKVGTGEIVRIAGRRGSWTRVTATDDRDGWLPSDRLLPLADRRPAVR